MQKKVNIEEKQLYLLKRLEIDMKKLLIVMFCLFVVGCSWGDVKRETMKKVHAVWIPKSKLLDVPHIQQLPELPRGCEVTSLAMLLQFKGVDVNKMELAKRINRDETPYQIKRNGDIHFGDPSVGFVGDMYSFDKPGLGVYHGPIYELANEYIPNAWEDLTGSDFSEVEKAIADEKPVWVIVTSTFDTVEEKYWTEWHTKQGVIKVTKKEHAVIITGYDENSVYVNDPLAQKNRKLDKKAFIRGWEQFGSQAITLY